VASPARERGGVRTAILDFVTKRHLILLAVTFVIMAMTGVAAWYGSGPVTLAAGACIVAYLALVPMWATGWASVRGVCIAAFALEVSVIAGLTWHTAPGTGAPGLPALCALAVFSLYALARWAAALRAPRETLDLSFPLKDGFYAVGQGGDGASINHHAASRQQRFALDIVKANGDIAGVPVLSPCSGTIVAANDDMPDEGSMQARGAQAFGNYVTVEHESGVLVVLAHLKSGTVCVRRGERVSAGQVVGCAGNSGRSTEPHLHVHAERNGDAVPLRFDGRWLVRNSLIRA